MADRVILLSARPTTVKKEFKIDLPRPRAQRSPQFYKILDAITADIDQAAILYQERLTSKKETSRRSANRHGW